MEGESLFAGKSSKMCPSVELAVEGVRHFTEKSPWVFSTVELGMEGF